MRPSLPRLHAITDDARLVDARFLDDARTVMEVGGSEVALHLRGRSTSAARLYELAVALKPVARETGACVFVNDRVDVALAAGVDGVQLREDSIDVASARAILGADARIGVSRHDGSLDREEGADFVVFGAIFRTDSHPDRNPAGIEALRWAASGVRRPASGSAMPLIAIGGVTPGRVPEVLAAGAYGIAAISGIWVGGGAAVAEYVTALDRDADSEAGSQKPDADGGSRAGSGSRAGGTGRGKSG